MPSANVDPPNPLADIDRQKPISIIFIKIASQADLLDRLPLPLLSAVLVLAGKCRTLGWIAFGTAMDMMYVRYERIRIYPTCVGGNDPPRYGRVRAGDYLLGKHLAAMGRGEPPE